MSLNLVNNESYEFNPERAGTFTPNFTPDTGSHIEIKQVGNIVFITGTLAIDGTWEDVSGNHLGDITGVGVPVIATNIPVKTFDGTDFHAGTISVVNGNGSTYIGIGVNEADSVMAINGFYFTV